MPSQSILEQKQKFVSELADKLKNSVAGVLVTYQGINVADDTKLRRDLREAGVEYSVVKNTLLKRALEQAGIEGLEDVLEGTTAIAFSADDHVASARIISKFIEDNKALKTYKIKAGFVEGKALDVAGVEALAKLPSKEALVAQVLGTMQAPISGFVRVLSANISGLAIVLNAIAEKKSA
ncbi:MAG: 50S ribosomal protein L10 [Clostridia bacterium]|nr:50S ribosomal protein L10 [Clostridia bacterium]